MEATTTLAPANPQPLSFGAPHVAPQYDQIELLPPAAAERLRRLRQRKDDAYRLNIPFSDVQEETTERTLAEQRLRQLQAHPQDHGFNLPPGDQRVTAAEKHLAKVSDDLKRLNERREERAAAFQAASQPLAACEAWLRDGRPHGTMLEDYDGPEPKLLKGENGILDAIENRRRRVRELKADQHRIRSAPFPSTYAKQRMREQIETLAMQGEPSMSTLIEVDGPVEFADTRHSVPIITGTREAPVTAICAWQQTDALALTCWVLKDALIKRLDAQIDAESDDAAALSHEDRQRREAEVLGDLEAVEFSEAELVWQAQAQGLPCEHRADCSPLAILQCRLVTTAATNELPETSPRYSWPWRR